MTVRSAKLNRRTRLAISVVGTGVTLSGALWLVFHHFVAMEGDFGPRPHFLEPWWMTLHGAFALAAVWLGGMIWTAHVGVAWRLSRRRLSGTSLIAILVWLSASGCLLYYVGDDRARSIIAALHWGAGSACPVFYAAHRLKFRTAKTLRGGESV